MSKTAHTNGINNNSAKLINHVNKLLIKKFGVPHRQKPLPNSLDLLIATILSQNTNDNNSFKAYQYLKSKFKNWKQLKDVKRTEIEKIIRVAGLAKQKSEAIKNLITELLKKGNFDLDSISSMDNDSAIQQLTGYKGVGVKTASCVLLFAMDRNVCPVDTHVHRTTNRIGIVNEKTPDKTFYSLNKKFPPSIAHSFHTNLIRLGREICTPSKPNCNLCPLIELCKFESKNFDKKDAPQKRAFMLLDNVS